MSHPSTTIVDALIGDEVCPLCFDRFSTADACSCVVCRVSSCPSCAEVLDADGSARCFACRPASQPAAKAARSAAPLSLPQPILTPQAARGYTPGVGAARLPALPFPLTTSPQGVRKLQVKPQGSVFIGLPTVSAQLTESLRTPAAPATQPKLARRPMQKLVLLERAVTLLAALIALFRRAFAAQQRAELRARLAPLAKRASHYGEAALRKLTALAGELAHWLGQHAQPRLRALSPRLLRSRGARVHVDPSRPIRP